MTSALRALLWELVSKNRVVFPALAILFALGAGLAGAVVNAGAEVWWANTAVGTVVVAFFASLLLGYALFTLMESHSGWRMNSMATRWFVLPVPSILLVLVPFLAAVAFMGLLMAVWSPVLHRLFRTFDTQYVYIVVISGVAAMQCVAWILPRKPGQFWSIAGVLFLAVFLFAVVPQESPGWTTARTGMMLGVGASIPLFAALGYYAARRNRCGDWAGEIPLHWLGVFLVSGRPRLRNTRSPGSALFSTDTLSVVSAFLLIWLAVAVLVTSSQVFLFLQRRPDTVTSLRLVALVGVHVLPLVGIVALAAAGLFVGCDPGVGFRTRLSSFRATLPVNAGVLASQRIVTAFLIWLIAWLPLLALVPWCDIGFTGGQGPEARREIAVALATWMALSAHVLIGALPVFLLGRIEGFPNLVLCAIASWAAPWLLTLLLKSDEGTGHPWNLVIGWLMFKVIVAAWGLVLALRAGHITWRFPVGLAGAWLAIAGVLIWVMPTWQSGGAWRAAYIAVFIPLARLAWCPLALAANRHR